MSTEMVAGRRTPGEERKTVGRWKKYTSAKQLRTEVEGYFKSISKVQVVKELVNTGKKDDWGHFIYELQPVTTDNGSPVLERIFHIPPTRGDLCTYLGISRETWTRYCDREENPQFADITEWAEDQLRNWRDKELLRRSGKNIKGLIHDMAINYGASEKQVIELRDKRPPGRDVNQLPLSERKAMLEEIAREYGGGGSG